MKSIKGHTTNVEGAPPFPPAAAENSLQLLPAVPAPVFPKSLQHMEPQSTLWSIQSKGRETPLLNVSLLGTEIPNILIQWKWKQVEMQK